jgi:phosphohistidine phosphatase SixA
MNVYLLRHAEAGEAPRDEERELTEHGRPQPAAVAAGIRCDRYSKVGSQALLMCGSTR